MNWRKKKILQKDRNIGLLAPLRKGTFGCGDRAHCTGIIKGDTIFHPTKGSSIRINGHFSCNSTGVVYMLKCPCGLPYVGQTSRSIKVRLNEHKKKEEKTKQEEKNERFSELFAKHFFHNKHMVSQLRWTVLEQVNLLRVGNVWKQLLRKEAAWRKRLDSLVPKGLHESFSLQCFL
ncbi:hypothetical protein XELAEV_18007857mg [Xenopus laevis]|uniref:GIY-YIG domain-containing protein n=1 Tax=Xenopus laevis TaxID=8355 RepID=A0A974E3U6_XENLA|nr:hypothetical protein XELAEV_18007857mg [Xenopus laevis]